MPLYDLMEFSGDAGPETLRLFLNPGTSEPANGTAIATANGYNYGDITGIDSQWNFSAFVDEIRVADTYNELAGVPEPSTVTLASLGLLGLGCIVGRRRRRT